MEETTLFPLSIDQQGLVYEDRNHKVNKIIAQFDGFRKEYLVSDLGERAALMVVRKEEILFVRQYRLLINDLAWEIPGGKINEGEKPETAAIRECYEETGIQVSNLKPLIDYHLDLDAWKHRTYIYFTEDFFDKEIRGPGQVTWIPLGSCLEMIFSKQIVDHLSIIALFCYYVAKEKKRI